MPIAIDLHSHTGASKKLPFNIGSANANVPETRHSGFAFTGDFLAVG